MNIEKRPNIPQLDLGDLRDSARPVVTLASDYSSPHVIALHHHYRAQLLYAISGVMTVTSRAGAWVVPPEQAVWVPAGFSHEVRSDGPMSMRSLYLLPSVARDLPSDCCVVDVSGLLRELIVELVRLGDSVSTRPAGGRLVAVLLDQLGSLTPAPLYLPLPQDSRVRSVASVLLDNPADDRTLGELARSSGASERTLARLFKAATGMTFGTWRRQVRLLAAVERLGRGESISAVAYGLGYQSPSAFVAMFRRNLGVSPGRYIRGLGDDSG